MLVRICLAGSAPDGASYMFCLEAFSSYRFLFGPFGDGVSCLDLPIKPVNAAMIFSHLLVSGVGAPVIFLSLLISSHIFLSLPISFLFFSLLIPGIGAP